ncbi:MAG: EamA family transporter [Acidobacteria bacterium]|nr:EamA family transporter [Acidobacteriota bacterium]
MGIYLVVPLSSALFYAMGVICRKAGLALYGSVWIATWITSLTACLVLSVPMVRRFSEFRTLARDQWMYFVLSGLFSSVAWWFNYTALDLGQVVVVTPLVRTAPLFTLFFSWIFLRGVARITARVAVGCSLVVLGVLVLF